MTQAAIPRSPGLAKAVRCARSGTVREHKPHRRSRADIGYILPLSKLSLKLSDREIEPVLIAPHFPLPTTSFSMLDRCTRPRPSGHEHTTATMDREDECSMQAAQGDILEDYVVPAAKAHAASIWRTMWVKENKRRYGSKGSAAGSRPVDDDNEAAGNKNTLSGGRESEPPIIDGPIYSPAYWRAWQNRARVKVF